jgi:hypothetical protein
MLDDTDVLSEHLSVEKQKRAERLILRGRRNVPSHRQVRQERRDVCGSQIGRMTLAVKYDVSADPMNVRLFGPPAVVPCADGSSHTIEQLWWRGH